MRFNWLHRRHAAPLLVVLFLGGGATLRHLSFSFGRNRYVRVFFRVASVGGVEISSDSSSFSSRQRLFSASRILVARTRTRLVRFPIPAERSESACRIRTTPFSGLEYSRRLVSWAQKKLPVTRFTVSRASFSLLPQNWSRTSSPGHDKANGPGLNAFSCR